MTTPLLMQEITSIIAGVTLFIGLWLSWKQYIYQKMESVTKADMHTEQNKEIIKLLKSIDEKLPKR